MVLYISTTIVITSKKIKTGTTLTGRYIDRWVQDYSNPGALAM